MKTGTGHGDALCHECGIDAAKVRELLDVLEGFGAVSVAARLRMSGYAATALLLENALKKVKI